MNKPALLYKSIINESLAAFLLVPARNDFVLQFAFKHGPKRAYAGININIPDSLYFLSFKDCPALHDGK